MNPRVQFRVCGCSEKLRSTLHESIKSFLLQTQRFVWSPSSRFCSNLLFLILLIDFLVRCNRLDTEKIMSKWRKNWNRNFSPSRAWEYSKWHFIYNSMTLWLSWSDLIFKIFFTFFCLFWNFGSEGRGIAQESKYGFFLFFFICDQTEGLDFTLNAL